MKTVVAVLLFTGMCLAANAKPQACPVQFTEVNPYSPMSHGYRAVLIVKAKNVSGKDIDGLKLTGAYFDATNDAHPLLEPLSIGSIKAGKQAYTEAVTSSQEFFQYSKDGMEVYLSKVAFSDGSTWQDDGSHECRGYSVPREKYLAKHQAAKQ